MAQLIWAGLSLSELIPVKLKPLNFQDLGVSKTSDHIQIKIKMPNPSQEPSASSKAQNEDLKDMDVLCTFKIKLESWNLDNGCIKDQWPYPNQDQDVEPQSGSSSILQSPQALCQR